MSFIEPAYAQSGASLAGFDLMSILPIALMFGVFYFFLIRPQQKKAAQQKDMLSSLRRGDRIVTSGGLIGVITKVISEQELLVEVAEDVRVRIARPMVADLLSKTEPMPEVAPEPAHKKASSKPKTRTGTSKKKTARRSEKS